MKHILLGSALLAALTLPAMAGTDTAPSSGKDMKDMKQVAQVQQSDAGFYVAAYGGANFDTWYGDNRQTISAGGTTASTNTDINSHWGGAGGLKAGYNFQSFEFLGDRLRLQPALEAEALYIGEDRSHSTNAFGVPDSEAFSSNSADFFVNGILRFKNHSIITPYIGIGVGMQYITTHGELTSTAPVGRGGAGKITGLDTSDFDFAAQGLFGLDIQVCQHVSIFTEYKFIDAFGTDAKNASVGGVGVGGSNATYRFKPDEIQQNLITAGVKYTF